MSERRRLDSLGRRKGHRASIEKSDARGWRPAAGLPGTRAGYGRTFESAAPESAKLIRIGLDDYGDKAWPTSYGRLMPTDTAVLGDGTEVLKELSLICSGAMSDRLREKVAQRAAKITEIHGSLIL